jgi:hypothetical protein
MNIIELAKQAGMVPFELFKGIRFIEVWLPEIERFAALVEAAARADEREACAKVCDEFAKDSDWPTVDNCAEAIRARGEQA